MKKRYSTIKPTLETATTDQLFTELMKRILKENQSSMYFIDSTSADFFPTWALHVIENNEYKFLAKEVTK